MRSRGSTRRLLSISLIAGLFVFGLGVTPAHAAVSCAFSAPTATISSASGDAATVSRGGTGAALTDPILVNNSACGSATVGTTDTIVWTTASTGAETFTIDMSNGPLAPGAADEPGNFDEIEFNVNLGTTGTNTFAVIGCDTTCDAAGAVYPQCASTNCGFSSNDGIVWGISGINLNGTGETDTNDDLDQLTNNPYTNTNNFQLTGGEGNDSLSLGGSSVVNTALGSSVVGTQVAKGTNTISGGIGDDLMYGGSTGDTFTGGSGDDRIQGRGGIDPSDGGTQSTAGDTLDCSSFTTNGTAVNLNLATPSVTNCDGADTLTVGAGGDAGNSFENVIGHGGTGPTVTSTITGDADNNVLRGGLGADTISGAAGDDTISGGAGNETLDGGTNGTIGDTLDCSTVAAATNVTVNLTGTSTTCHGTDTLTAEVAGNSSFENVIGNPGSGVNTLTGDPDNNRLQGGTGADPLIGNAGDDYFIGGAGTDTFTGGVDGTGGDTVDCSTVGSTAVVVNLTIFTGQACHGNDSFPAAAAGDVGNSIENVIGGSGADTLTGGLDDNVFTGGGGNDTLDGAGDGLLGDTLNCSTAGSTAVVVDLANATATCDGTDSLEMGTGTDIGNSFENVIGGSGADTITGGGDDNRFQGGPGIDTLDGGGDIAGDTVDCSSSSSAATVNLSTAAGAGTSSISGSSSTTCDGVDILETESVGGNNNSFENIIGTSAADTLTGDADDNKLTGGASADTMDGGTSGTTGDTLDCSTVSGTTAVTVNLSSAGAPTITATCHATDVLAVETNGNNSFENAIGNTLGTGVNTLTGDPDNNRLQGGGGADPLVGNAGDDYFIGGAGNDSFNGGQDGAAGDTVDCSAPGTAVTVSLGTFTGQTCHGSDSLLVATVPDTGNSVENLIGGSVGDTLTGDADDNTLTGGSGNDGLSALGDVAGDTLDCSTAGATTVTVDLKTTSVTCHGTDTLTNGVNPDTGSNFENVIGGTGNDTLTGDADTNSLVGGPGSDVLDGGNGTDDAASYSTSTQGVVANLTTPADNTGDASGDTYTLVEYLVGSSFDDTLIGDVGSNSLSGGSGNDTLAGLENSDIYLGGSGTDTADYSASVGGVNIDLAAGTADNADINIVSDAEGDVYGSGGVHGIENLNGSGTDDILTGDANTNDLAGGGGDDEIKGAGGTDTVTGDAGDDDLHGGAAADALDGGNGYDVLTGGVAGDSLNDSDSDPDTLSYTDSASGVNVNIGTNVVSGGDAAGDVITGTFHNVVGSFTAGTGDTITGNNLDNFLIGGNGTDTISGGDGEDSLMGGPGSDTLNGENGDDMIAPGNDQAADIVRGGSAGTDTGTRDLVSYANCTQDRGLLDTTKGVIVDLTSALAQGCYGLDTISGVEQIRGSPSGDMLTGTATANFITGGAGADTINAGAGDDTITGARGGDIAINGQAGDDTLLGGLGDDALDGGADLDSADGEDGNDTCVAEVKANCEV